MKLKLVSVILAIIGVVWWLLMIIFGAFTGGFFEIICIALFALLFAAVIFNIEQDNPESGDPYHSAYTYLGIACIGLGLIFNTVFLAFNKTMGARIGIGGNIALIGLYVIAALILKNTLISHDARTANAAKTRDSLIELSGSINRILGAIHDPDVKKAFLKVKEAVEYGSKTNLSTDRIDGMKTALEAVRSAIASDDSKEEIMARISAAETLWKSGIVRN